MFGKGVYFADMVSKSANYCRTSRSDPTGLMLLCEVALGNMLAHFLYSKKISSGLLGLFIHILTCKELNYKYRGPQLQVIKKYLQV